MGHFCSGCGQLYGGVQLRPGSRLPALYAALHELDQLLWPVAQSKPAEARLIALLQILHGTAGSDIDPVKPFRLDFI